MTAVTPEQMHRKPEDGHGPKSLIDALNDARAALRAAADQLEAVRRMHHERDWRPLDGTYIGGTYCAHCRRPWPCSTYHAVTADAAPQESDA